MTQQQIINHTIDFVKETLHNAEGGHDWFHIQRVYQNAMCIAKEEKVDTFVVELGALLHDIADAKFHEGNEELGPQVAQTFLETLPIAPQVIEHVVSIVKHCSFKGGNTKTSFVSPELYVVQDADRLDAIGAIGIARCFNYGGFKNRALYDPEIEPNLSMDSETYKASTAPTINHFYEKLLLLKDRMHTQKGKALAIERHQFMEQFLQQFYKEWGSTS